MKSILVTIFSTAVAIVILTVMTVAVEPFVQQARLAGISGPLAASGNTVIINSSDGVHVLVRSGLTWTQQAMLVPSDGIGVRAFPYPLAIDGDTVVLGGTSAVINGVSTGAAYVFVRNGSVWSEQQRLIASDGAAGDGFGRDVSISGNSIIVSSWLDDIGASANQGSAYIFVRQTGVWLQQSQLLASDGGNGELFGLRTTLSGDTAVAITGRIGVNNAPAAYVFVRSGVAWSQQTRLSVCEPSANNLCDFGSSVAVEGDTLAVGNDFLNVGANTAAGGVYMFARAGTTWTQQQRITSAEGLQDDNFGSAVSLNNNTLVVGAPAGNVRPGSVYIYAVSGQTWSLLQPRLHDGSPSSGLGSSVSINGNTVVFSAPGASYIYSNSTPTITHAPFDFDGDGKADLSIYRPSNGQWWWQRSSDGVVPAFQFGTDTDKIAPGDYTGDGKMDITVWRPSTGFWYVLRSEDFLLYGFQFGADGDIPVPGDYDGDGKTDAAVFRPSTVTWFISKSSGGTTIQSFGAAGDKPVVADYDGDGKTDIAIYRPSNGQWWWQRSSDGVVPAFQFGNSTDKPVQGDYTGDGKADIAIWRPSTGFWYILRSEDFLMYAFPWGLSTDIPTPGDYDGDGKFDASVFRPSGATWFVSRSTAGTLIQQFGAAADQPVPSAFVP